MASVKVKITQDFTYRKAEFVAGKVYDVDQDLVPGWVERWITAMGYGVVLGPDPDTTAEPDPRSVVAPGSSKSAADSSGAEEDGPGDQQEKGKKKLTLPDAKPEAEPAAKVEAKPAAKATPEPATAKPSVDGDKAQPERTPLGGDEPVKVTSSENVPSALNPTVHVGGKGKPST